jgi:uncharacterized protein (DUF2336 family)
MSPQAFELSRLVSMEPGPRRDKLTLALADTLADVRLKRRETSEVIGEALMGLVVAASRELRMIVAAKVADAAWAPRELALSLALDEISVAEPVIARCRTLLDDDLVTIARRGSPSHRRTLAERVGVSERVCDALAAAAEPDVLGAMLENTTAQLSRDALRTCVDVARAHLGLHRPLVARDGLPREIVEAIYLVVSDELRAEIAARYVVDEESLRRVIGAAVKQAAGEGADAEVIDAENAALVRALRRSGALSGEFVTRAALEGQIDILDHAVACITGIAIAEVRAALEAHEAWAAALCCRICDIPRRDFPAIVDALVQASRIPAIMSTAIERAATQAFVAHSPASAADALRRIARAG